MFQANDIYPHIKTSDIFSKISEYDIFKKYCSNFKELDKSFLSEFYKDKNPSCRITQSKSNALYYKDYGTGDGYNCFKYIMFKYSCSFQESLLIICNDFNLFKVDNNLQPTLMLGKDTIQHEVKPRVKPTITIQTRSWNNIDYNYWSKYGIDFGLLESFDVYPVKYCYLHKGDKTVIFESTKTNPIYGYRFEHEGKYSYKIYKPLSPDKKYKWLFSGGSKYNIEGFDQLPLFGNLLIISKALKDVMVLKTLGYSAISLQGEANTLEYELVEKLLKRFKEIIVFYDQDNQGIKSANAITQEYGFKSIFIPLEYKAKDISDFVEKFNIKLAKELMWKLINT